MALPFEVKKYMKENNRKKSTACNQQSIANSLVANSMPMNNGTQPMQQIPAKQ